eukprot:GHVR01104609.1.p1 GENE.GHVR01104609.1~~GHVR01104609.1.p1  ORF type:complete len:109 (-),score=1.84 GHVR01104609.1:713-1039(-)
MYIEFYRDYILNNSYLCYLFDSVKKKQNYIVNKVDLSNLRKLWKRQIAKINCNQSFQLSFWIIRKLTLKSYDYEAIIMDIITLYSLSTGLTYEILIFQIINYLHEKSD